MRDEAARLEQGDGVGVGGGQVEAVQRGHDGDTQFPDEFEDVELVADVEVVGGLVEHEQPRLLGQCAGQQHPLAFAAGQLTDPPVPVGGQAGARHGVVDRRRDRRG